MSCASVLLSDGHRCGCTEVGRRAWEARGGTTPKNEIVIKTGRTSVDGYAEIDVVHDGKKCIGRGLEVERDVVEDDKIEGEPSQVDQERF